MNAVNGITVLVDDLGLQREYTEVKRKARVGERIKITEDYDVCRAWVRGDTFIVEGISRYSDGIVCGAKITDKRDKARVIWDANKYVVLEPSDIVRIDGARFRVVERKADVGERVVVTGSANGEADRNFRVVFPNGSVGIVLERRYPDRIYVKGPVVEGKTDWSVMNGDYRVLEPLDSSLPLSAKPAHDQYAENVARLTADVASLTRRVTELERTRPDRDVFEYPAPEVRIPSVGDRVIIVDETRTNIGKSGYIRNGGTYVIVGVDAADVATDDYPYSLRKLADEGEVGVWCKRESFVFEGESAPQLRKKSDVTINVSTDINAASIAEGLAKLGGGKRKATEATREATREAVIERAKADIDGVRRTWSVDGSRRYIRRTTVCNEEFIVNRDKRTVVCILRWDYNDKIVARSKSRCAPDDVFNVHIGKAIALRRALGLDVPDEYVNAPKPTEVNVGDIVILRDGGLYTCGYPHKLAEIEARGERLVDDSGATV